MPSKKQQLMHLLQQQVMHHPMAHHVMHHPMAHHAMRHPLAKHVIHHPMTKHIVPRAKKQMMHYGGIAGFGMGGELLGGRKKRATLPKSGHKRNVARGDIVASIMRQHNLSLGQASKYVKQHGLY